MPLRRPSLFAAVIAAASVASLASAVSPAVASAATAPAAAAPIPLLPSRTAPTAGDHLTVTVSHSGGPATDGTYELRCHPAGGTHPAARSACALLDRLTTWGSDPFAPVASDSQCTMQYGGPATARVTGVWAGRPVKANFKRSNGCEISRWDRFEPLLPATAS
ncbi:SSI family serine proteinase inhibitor [Streptomyces sp. MST-110588]|uniref:SSI family serine proteinase inhibitor n=1 Tax=Streptomyces sp. MST-110588 TaxID=2833628 RepID=UPI001F5D9734|nr:SSI family serine proteinase inhibitor [Streptomyces sp. MST-110588]UNO40851.1 hypothetical protein KGS77_16285 [Streptomyces sp. MST-110588]